MKLISIQDGDTFTVDWLPTTSMLVRIRLADIDAPERGEPLHRQAREELAAWLRGGITSIELAARQDRIPDPCNRLVAYPWRADGFAQEHMIRNGFAVVWCPRGPNQHTTRLIQLESLAKAQGVGVWSMNAHRLCSVYTRPRPRR